MKTETIMMIIAIGFLLGGWGLFFIYVGSPFKVGSGVSVSMGSDLPCKRMNIDGLNCVRDGMTGGFFDNHIYYVCEGYGKIALSCSEYWTNKTEFIKYFTNRSSQ